MNIPEEVARWLMDGGDNAIDVEFAETFVLMYKIYKEKPGDKEISLTKEDMTEADTQAIANMVKAILDEVLFSKEIDSSAWWKQEEKK